MKKQLDKIAAAGGEAGEKQDPAVSEKTDRIKILYATSELAPYAYTGGLGDVSASLPPCLGRLGAEIRVVMPCYRGIRERLGDRLHSAAQFTVSLSWRRQDCEILEAEMDGYILYLVRCDYYYGRGALYGYYDSKEALALACQISKAKFDETIEVHVRLGVDSRHADQQVRGAVVLPNGTGKKVRTLVFAKGDKAKAAEEAGSDYVGAEDLVEKIQKENWFDYDVIIATPDMMGLIGRLGKILGPKGLMPNPKAGTVTMDVAKAVTDAKAGKIEYRLDKTNIIHCPVGKVSFGADKLAENFDTLLGAIIKAKPASAKGQYIKSCVIASTMGPGLKVNSAKLG